MLSHQSQTTTNVAVDGRLLAINGAVTLDTNKISVVGTDGGNGDNGNGGNGKGDNDKGEHDEGHHNDKGHHHDKDAKFDKN